VPAQQILRLSAAQRHSRISTPIQKHVHVCMHTQQSQLRSDTQNKNSDFQV